jgi:CO dehydrogenase nickel-insertion accessory protein CooC1
MLEPTVETLATEAGAAVPKVDADRNEKLAGQYGVQSKDALAGLTDAHNCTADLCRRSVNVLLASPDPHVQQFSIGDSGHS